MLNDWMKSLDVTMEMKNKTRGQNQPCQQVKEYRYEKKMYSSSSYCYHARVIFSCGTIVNHWNHPRSIRTWIERNKEREREREIERNKKEKEELGNRRCQPSVEYTNLHIESVSNQPNHSQDGHNSKRNKSVQYLARVQSAVSSQLLTSVTV